MGRFNEFYITCTLVDLIDYLNLLSSTFQRQSIFSDQSAVVTHKLIELKKTCMAAILKALSTGMNENTVDSRYLDFGYLE